MIEKAMFLLIKIVSQMLLKIGSTSVTQIRFLKRSSNLASQTLLKICSTSVLKISFTSYSKLLPQVLLEIDP